MSLPGSVGIAGLGVMGGSLARALTERGVRVIGFSPDSAEVAAALETGAIAEGGASVRETAERVDCLVLATPLGAFDDVFSDVFGDDAAGAEGWSMDVGSLQQPALTAAAKRGRAAAHVSAHPMAGSERSGFAASRGDLYEGVPVWLSTGPEVSESLRSAAERFWVALGAVPAWIAAEDHDTRMAAASHLPQLTANALAAVLAARGLEVSDLGPGGRDTTRLAASSPVMWKDLLAESRDRVAPLLRQLSEQLDRYADHLEAGDLESIERFLAETRGWRQA